MDKKFKRSIVVTLSKKGGGGFTTPYMLIDGV